MNWTLHCGDALSVLKTLEPESVNCVVTSPPYWGLRDYGTGRWDGGSDDCLHAARAQAAGSKTSTAQGQLRDKPSRLCRCGAVRIDRQVGLEPTPDDFVDSICAVFAVLWGALRDDAAVWLNLGDSYAGSWGAQSREHAGKHAPNISALSANQVKAAAIRESGTGSLGRTPGLKAKDLVGIPWRVAFALQADGWYLRSDVIWSKPNPMPESVRDRPTKAHEYVFLLTKSERYAYNADAIREPVTQAMLDQMYAPYDGEATKDYEGAGVQNPSSVKARIVNKARYKAANIPGQSPHGYTLRDDGLTEMGTAANGANVRTVWSIATEPSVYDHFAVMPKALARKCILAGCPFGGVVLDPFAGVCTTGVVALEEGRSFVGIELNPKYHAMGRERLANVAPLLATEVSA